MFNKIVLAGGSGYLGKVLSAYYKNRTKEIVILTRGKNFAAENIRFVHWDGKTDGPWSEELEGADLLINLCGKNVNCRYTKKNREEIFRSRLEPTALLGKVSASLKQPPKAWINLASATIYRHAEDHYQDEGTGETGSGFSVEVCQAWEKTFREATVPGTRKILLRVGIVFGRSDGVIPRLKNLVRTGLGGYQGTGRQFISWIHEQDLARITEWVYRNAKDGDVFNCTAPEAIQNREMMKVIRESYGIPFGLPSPQWLLEAGAVLIGTETELILKSRWVYPKHLLDKGFRFQYSKAAHAIHEILSTRI